MKKFTIEIEDELLEWVRNYQYTALVVMDSPLSIKDIISEALIQYRRGIALPIQERPNYIKKKEQSRSINIKKGCKAATRKKN